MTTLTATSTQPETIRFIVCMFLFSVLSAQFALLLEFAFFNELLAAATLIGVLPIAFAYGYKGAGWDVIMRRPWLARIRFGFAMCAAGMVWLVVASEENHGFSLLPGIIVSGLAQGAVFRTLSAKYCGFAIHPRFSHYSFGMMMPAILLCAGICLVIPLRFTGLSGFPYAFALLADLSFLAALYTKIAEDDRSIKFVKKGLLLSE